MSQFELVGLIVSYVYAFSLLLIVEAAGKRWRWPLNVSRKIIHIGAGMWTWGILYFFHHRLWGILPFATFILLNYLFYRRRTFSQMDAEKTSPGTVYFAVSITLLFSIFWWPKGPIDHIPVAMAGIMAMTWGDAFAGLIGQPWGKKTYTTFGHARSWLGSALMMLISFIAIWLTLTWLPGSSLSPFSTVTALPQRFLLSIVGTMIATASEALSPAGTDNLTVPLITSFLLYLLGML
ncbi:MAG TPA: phosphatidate cytidylyltransferase [bacterium]|nr:phosphatidate cytidylyltransferase [bacterium]HPN34185.1 phosphatidate cytidylyltransferase [bacterium]